MDLSLEAPLRERLKGIRALGRGQIRPLGLEADRLGRPTPPDHEFFELLVELGQGRTRWKPQAEADPQVPKSPKQVGDSRSFLCIAEEMSYWDRGVAVSFPGPGLAVALPARSCVRRPPTRAAGSAGPSSGRWGPRGG